MRDIKFRMWYEDCETMDYMNNWEQIQSIKPWVFEESPVMQYTGVKDDKNGTEIYEGDIVKYLGNMTGRVFYDEAETSFILEPADSKSSYEVLGLQCDLEVIGNEFENPELLKEGRCLR